MNEMGGSGRFLRSIGAVLAGIVVGVVLSLGTDTVLHATHVFPPWGQPMSDALFLLATIYRTIYGVAAAFITARLAPSRPMRHALAAGAVGLIVSTVGALATWNRGPALGPHWYPVALIVLALPTAWMGGWLRLRQLAGRVNR